MTATHRADLSISDQESMRTWNPDRDGDRRTTPRNVADEDTLELTILMPCLNEEETIAVCVRTARSYLERSGVRGEVLVADNGSTDRSIQLAEAEGARVVSVSEKGYGAALMGGVRAARGTFVIMGDADDSYDFSSLDQFVERLRAGDHLVMGNRFAGGIEPGAMPWLHRWIGNPVLSWLGRTLFGIPVRDFHCGLRGFRRQTVLNLGLHTTGMEWASEVVVANALAGRKITEVPTTLRPDGRSRPPHLRSFRDGWRHLRFLLLYSPKWLFLLPGLVAFVVGAVAAATLVVTPVTIGGVGFDIGTLLYACAATVLGYQAMWFAMLTRRYGEQQGFLPPGDRYERVKRLLSLERGLAIGGLLIVAGFGLAVASFARWSGEGFGEMNGAQTIRIVAPATLGLILGFQTVLSSVFWSLLGIETRPAPVARTFVESSDSKVINVQFSNVQVANVQIAKEVER